MTQYKRTSTRSLFQSHRRKTRLPALSLIAMTALVTGCASDGSPLTRMPFIASSDRSASTDINTQVQVEPATSMPRKDETFSSATPEPVTLVNHQNPDTNYATVSHKRPATPIPRTELLTLDAGDRLEHNLQSEGRPVLLDFYADWCGPCRSQGEILHELERDATGPPAKIIKINVDHHPQIAKQFRVGSLPTLVLVKDGKVAKQKTGLTQRKELLTWLQTVDNSRSYE